MNHKQAIAEVRGMQKDYQEVADRFEDCPGPEDRDMYRQYANRAEALGTVLDLVKIIEKIKGH